MKRAGFAAVALLIFLAASAPGSALSVNSEQLPHSASPAAVAPAVPANLQVPFATNSSVRLIWQSPVSNGGSPVTNYTIYRGTSTGAESLYKVLGNVNSFVDPSLQSDTSYFYKVSATNAVGEGRPTYEVAVRVGSSFSMTLGSTFFETGQFLNSYSSQSPRSTLASSFVSVWTTYTNASTTFNLKGIPAGTHPYPLTFPYTNQGAFSFTINLVTDAASNPGTFPLTLSAAGPQGDNESIGLTLNVRSLAITASPSTVFLGQNATIVGALCPFPSQVTWANATYNVVYQRPDGTQLAHNSTVSITGSDLCGGSPALDRFAPSQTGVWYVRATANLETWDGSTEFISTLASGQPNYPPSFSISFTVTATPPRSLNVSLSAVPATVQNAGTSVVRATTTASDGASPAVTYLWSVTGGALNSTGGNPVLWSAPQVQSATSYTVSVVASSQGYVQGTASTSILVLPPQGPRAAITTNSSTGFAPFTVLFTGGVTNGVPPYVFAWNFGDGVTSGLQNATHTFATAGNYTTTLTVTDSRMLTSTTTVTIRVNPRPVLFVNISANVNNGTAPLTVRFTSSVTGGFPPYSYSWAFGDGNVSTNTSAVHTFLAAGKYTTILTVTDSLGLMASASVQVQVTVSTYTVTFSAIGLPPGTPWSVTFGGHSYSSSTNTINVASVTSGSYQWTTGEVDTCQGCRFIPLLTGGALGVPGNLSRQISFQSQFLVAVVASPANGGGVTPAGSTWYVSGTVVMLTARPNGTLILHSWSASSGITIGTTSIVGGTAQASATIGGPGTITAGFADAWQGSFIKTYYGNQTWKPVIMELHIASADSTGDWATSPTTFAGILQSGGSSVVGNVGQAGSIFSFITTEGGLAGKADSNGSHDFTIVQLAGGLAYIYPGLLSEGTMSGTPLGGIPVWVPLLSMPVPVSDKLVFGPAILPYATTAALGQAPNAPSVSVLSLNIQPAGLGLTVKDSQGRVSGIDPQTDKVVSGIPGSFAAHVGNVLAVVIPGNISAFSYFVDGIRATQPSVNFTVTLQSLGTTGVSAEKDVTAAVAQGSVDTFSALAGPAEIDSVQLFQVSLSAIDLLGLPAPGTSVTLVSPTGASTNLALGESKMVPGGNYSVSVNYAGRTTHESFVVTKDGTIPVKVSLSYYSILIIGVIVAAICGIAVRQARRVKKSVKKNVKKIKQTIKPEEESEWLK